MPRLISVTVPQKALLHIPDLVGIAPVPPTQRVRGRKDFDLRPELMVGHKVEFIISAKISSDGFPPEAYDKRAAPSHQTS